MGIGIFTVVIVCLHCAHTILLQTALHLATHMQQTEMIRKLLIAGAALDITDHKGNTPLHIAARFSSTKSLEEIIRYMSVQTILQVARIKNNEGLTCIHIAAKHGNMDTLRKFKNLGVDVDMQVRKCNILVGGVRNWDRGGGGGSALETVV